MVKLVVCAVFAFSLTFWVVGKAIHAIANKQKYRLGYLDGGQFFHNKEVDPRWMLLLAGVYFTVICALVAWPLGLYE